MTYNFIYLLTTLLTMEYTGKMNGGLFMAQVLKEEVRQKILDSAKREFLNNDFEKASMRKIAKSSGMTVGNLYRYYDNKEKLFGALVDTHIERINDFLTKNDFVNTNLYEMPLNDVLFSFDKELAYERINKVIEFIMDMAMKGNDGLILLLSKSRGYKYGKSKMELIEWFSKLLQLKLMYEKNTKNICKEDILYAKSLAKSFVEGICILIEEYDSSIDMATLFKKHIELFFFK